MTYTSVSQLIADCEARAARKRLAVICADDPHTLEAVGMASVKNIITPILIGDREGIQKHLKDYPGLEGAQIVHAPDKEQAVQAGVDLVREHKAEALMKGHIETAPMLRGVVRKENGICESGVVSHLTIADIPNYPKLLGITDGALVTYPTLEQKKEIINNAVNFMGGLLDDPVKVACLAAVEVVNPKMQETVEARQLQEMFQGDPRCIVEGPMSYDLAVDLDAQKEKDFHSRIGGRADVVLTPDIVSGNILLKALFFSAQAPSLGLILGAKVPVVLSSRSSPTMTKYQSIAVAVC